VGCLVFVNVNGEQHPTDVAQDPQHPSGALRAVAVVEGILALCCALIGAAFLPNGHRLGGDGILEGMRFSFILFFVFPAVLFGYSARRAWRGDRRWWQPSLLAILGSPIVLVLTGLFV